MENKEEKTEEIKEENQEEVTACDESETLKKEIEELKEKLKAEEDKYLRVHADFENTKKRLEREKYQGIEYAKESFAKDLLPVCDSLEFAINSVVSVEELNEETLDNLKKGIELTIDQFQKNLSKHYVEAISTDEAFDPNLHQAMAKVDSNEHESGQIVQVMQKGYRLKDRILRPSMVTICK